MGISAIVALSIFVVIFVLISLEKINKTIVVLLGAMVFIVSRFISQENMFNVIDWNVIFLLMGMMIIVGITRKTGLFQFVAIKIAKLSRGEPAVILIALSIATAFFSAFLDNVTTVMVITPVAILIAVEMGISPVPFIISSAIASNLGGAATLIGDPPNIMIGSAAKLTFIDFLNNLSPIVVLCTIVFSIIIYFIFGRKMKISTERKARIMDFDETKAIENKTLLIKSVSVIGAVIVGFMLHSLLKLEPSVVAMFGASVLMLLTGEKEVEEFFNEIEWGSIFFFIGLFIIIGGLVELGVIERISRLIMSFTKGNVTGTTLLILWSSSLLSSVVDNIPYAATMIPLIKDIALTVGPVKVMPMWWALALGTCLGGNGTLIGASANIIAVGIAKKNGYKISFMQFTKYGILILFTTISLSTIYLYLRYLMRM